MLFEEPVSVSGRSDTTEFSRTQLSDNLSVLVAEDDPINSKIMKKRLEKLGHSAYMTVNGEECASAHGENPASFDAILMDLQMPIVDGFSSTKMIRSLEKTRGSLCLSSMAEHNGRVPIFAVSASLVEKEHDRYVQTGFDGWILKPVDFQRVDLLLKGIADTGARAECLYEPGKWERGGWFSPKEEHHDAFEIDTHPNMHSPTTVPGPLSFDGIRKPSLDRLDTELSTPSEATVVPASEAHES